DNNNEDEMKVPIGHSDDIDHLAKRASMDGDEIQHDPFISSFKLHLKKRERENLKDYIKERVQASRFKGYPERDKFKILMTINERKIEPTTPLLNRARTGHSCARNHLKNL
ncbi:hypothetical protein B5P41_33405, partial [Bacillus sp. SRB_28]